MPHSNICLNGNQLNAIVALFEGLSVLTALQISAAFNKAKKALISLSDYFTLSEFLEEWS